MEHFKFSDQIDEDSNAAFATMTPWIVVLDQELRIISSNDPGRTLVNFSPDDLAGRKFEELTGLHHLCFLIKKSFCLGSQAIFAFGKKLVCDYEPIFENQKPAGGILTIGRTTFEDFQCMQFDEIVNAITSKADIEKDGVVIVNREGFITMVNQAFANALGARIQNVIGRHIMKSSKSRLSRLPIVMQTGKAEVGVPHFINGRNVTVSRYPLIKDGKIIGALGKIHLVDEILDSAGRSAQAGAAGKKRHDFRYDVDSIIGRSQSVLAVKDILLQVADKGSNVLLMGESGTGKELFAHALHAASSRRSGPFIKVNCAAIPEQLLESELFGYVEGAFTGAKKGGQPGKFELAHKGTIFLDEIGDMSLPMQSKLLRVLQEKEVAPLGSTTTRHIDVRVIAATNADLEELVKEGKFRMDLYYRLNIVTLTIPPLREREGDIELLTRHFLQVFNTEFGLNVQDLALEAWSVLKNYDFPGNVRELRNIIERAFNVVRGCRIEREDLPHYMFQSSSGKDVKSTNYDFTAGLGLKPMAEIIEEIVEEVERSLIEKALAQTKGNKPDAANLLGISRAGLYNKLQKYKLQ
jgi:transcriptional regulator with PAS, ATPase and Fis domain